MCVEVYGELSGDTNTMSHAHNSFPILAISILGILTTVILLVSYYLFVIKCCINWRRSDVLTRLTTLPSRRRRPTPPFLSSIITTTEPPGLDAYLIQSIPIFRFTKASDPSFHECAVCLNEFQEDEKLRVLPSCSHAFHIDCIDVWLQTHPNCPLCRSLISPHHLLTPQTQSIFVQDFHRTPSLHIDLPHEPESSAPPPPPIHPPRKTPSMGDECIDVRGSKDESFSIQPIRRSFSMDSSCDRQLYLSVQEALQRGRHLPEEVVGSSSKVRRSFFSFGHGRSSRSSSVLPIHFEP
ncbi:hypothetical protein J5N97_024260 [Dioscorea zingiberensis]|uniref:RING-type E3 ubiquitin transferase n=1 Tax=Dioscorea zingiberensis TaxID=325984 RepID=A0A9D5C6P3_9LILI|nr:hypothetical protein J5N97_024260 [Dioscorea zingiberensis]